jgi:hypothetical protein
MDSSFTMAATAFLVFYRFKGMSKMEAQKAKDEWNQLKESLDYLGCSESHTCSILVSCSSVSS